MVVDDTLGDERWLRSLRLFDDAAEVPGASLAALALRLRRSGAFLRPRGERSDSREIARITQLSTRRPQHRLDVAVPRAQSASAVVEPSGRRRVRGERV